jgi:hypothetical protein
MKNNQNRISRENVKYNLHKRPEIRDDMDSRKNEEQDINADNVTHNKKERHSERKTKKK